MRNICFRLDKKKVIITGGARGIGREVAWAFADAGPDVVIWDINLSRARETAKKINDMDKEAIAIIIGCVAQEQKPPFYG